MFTGPGSSISFMAILGERFPCPQFFVTGTSGPGHRMGGLSA